MEFLNGHFQAWKSHGKNLNHQTFGKVMEICYNHVFIYAEFEIINIFCNPPVTFTFSNIFYPRGQFDPSN